MFHKPTASPVPTSRCVPLLGSGLIFSTNERFTCGDGYADANQHVSSPLPSFTAFSLGNDNAFRFGLSFEISLVAIGLASQGLEDFNEIKNHGTAYLAILLYLLHAVSFFFFFLPTS